LPVTSYRQLPVASDRSRSTVAGFGLETGNWKLETGN
jgi:hypothetical protein